MVITKQGGPRRSRVTASDKTQYSIMQQSPNERIPLVTFTSLADCALVSRFLDGGNLPDDLARRAIEIMNAADNNHNDD